jgi:transcriptional regulator with XRE-family HTH domain
MRLNQYLKAARLKAGLSQRDVAKALGFSTPQFVSNWERHQVGVPPEHFLELSKMYQVPLVKLVRLSVRDYQARLLEEINC